MANMFSLGVACARPTHVIAELPVPSIDLPEPKDGETMRTAIFAGGCFWCTEAVFEQLAGVIDVVSGYAGDSRENAEYKKVGAGETRHAEAIQVTYDPRKITYGQLLRVFFTAHDPTTLNRQGPDWGPQYRSAIFYQNDDEKRVAETYLRQLADAKAFDKPIVTTLEPIGAGFFEAELYHQDFAKRNPNHPYIVQWAIPKLDKVKKTYPDRSKDKDNDGEGKKSD
jgi:peptide-methionine (S)-S-oxide reductase